MLNLAAIGLFVAISSFTGGGMPAMPVSTSPDNIQVQQLEAGKKDESKEVTTEAYVKNYFSDIPILAEIARCESEFRQTDKNGKVLRGIKDPRDVGVMQVNEYYHGKQAIELGYDIYTLQGNVAYARYLYEERGEGARPWMASSACWSRSKELAVR
jgi:hypothetical protein